MGFQQRARTPRDFGRRPRRNKAQTKPGKRPTGSGNRLGEEHVATLAETVDRTVNSLSRLGSQRFAVSPFHEHYDRWLLSVRTILSEFELNPAVNVDDRFREECSKALSGIELILKERRVKEMSKDDTVRKANRGILDAKNLLARAEREHATKKNQIAGEREHAIKPVAMSLGRLREELNRIVRMRAGFLRGISKKAKTEKTTEAAEKLDYTKKELAKIEQSYAFEQRKLESEFEKSRRKALEQIANYQREIEDLENGVQADDALDAREAACDALIDAVNSLLQRTSSRQEDLSKP